MELQLKRDRLQEVKEGIKVGDLFFDKRGEEIIRIQEIEEKQYRKDDPRWDWNGSHERKNSLFFKFSRDESTVINYDQLNLDDIEFYLNSRIDRPNYLEYLPILKKLRKCLLEEQDQEDAFYLMLVGRCQKEGLKPKEGLSYEKIIGELIDWWKYKNKWKRPISKNDELAMKMIEKGFLLRLTEVNGLN